MAVILANTTEKTLSASIKKGAFFSDVNSDELTPLQRAGLTVSMPKDAEYPKAWAQAMKHVPSKLLREFAATIADRTVPELERFRILKTRLIERIAVWNRAQWTEAREAKKYGPLNGEALTQLSESERVERYVLWARRAEHCRKMMQVVVKYRDRRAN